MELHVEQATFARALRLAGRIAATRSSYPVLQAVLLTAERGGLTLAATDGDLGLRTTVEADVVEVGEVAVPARLLADYAAQLPAAPLHLALDRRGTRLRATCGRAQATFATLPPCDFPALPAMEGPETLSCDAQALERTLARVLPAVGRDTAHPVLATVCCSWDGTGLTLAACDGYRLAQARLPAMPGRPRRCLLPARAAAEWRQLLAGGDEVDLIPTDDGRGLWLLAGGTRLYARLVEGDYPPVAGLIPAQGRTRVTVETAAFRRAARLIGAFGVGHERPIILEAEPEGLRLRTPRDADDAGEAEVAATVEGMASAVALNGALLADLLAAESAHKIVLHWSGSEIAVVARQVFAPDDATLWLVMPLHLPELALPQREAA